MGDPGFYTGLSDSRTKILIIMHLVPVFNDAFVPLKYKCTPFGHIKLKSGHIRLTYIGGFVEYTLFFVQVYKKFESYGCLCGHFCMSQRYLNFFMYLSQRNVMILTYYN